MIRIPNTPEELLARIKLEESNRRGEPLSLADLVEIHKTLWRNNSDRYRMKFIGFLAGRMAVFFLYFALVMNAVKIMKLAPWAVFEMAVVFAALKCIRQRSRV